jgi:Acyl-protein synthetase, LuxE
MSLADDLLSFIKAPGDCRCRDILAVRLFEDQCESVPGYRRYVGSRRARAIDEIPGVPESVYKGGGIRRSGSVARTFRSSGTSGGNRTVVELSEEGLALMDAAILAGAKRHLFWDSPSLTVLLLVPAVAEAPDVIMAYGMDLIGRNFGCETPQSFVRGGSIDFRGLALALQSAASNRSPVLLAGGSFAFVHFFQYCQENGLHIELPPGSRTLDAGGFKGRSREILPEELRRTCESVLGVRADMQVNLLGMTELASQLYDRRSGAGPGGEYRGLRVKVNDPWTHTSVIDPLSGEPTSSEGMLKHVDLAIYDRPCAIVTADLGVLHDGGFCFIRRAQTASQRGCALSVAAA